MYPRRPSSLEFALLGEHDYWQEMKLILKALPKNRKP